MVKTRRCSWGDSEPLYRRYHDEEWGVPCREPGELFELLLLEGMQAGLSWITILKKRRHMRQVFKDFEPVALAGLTDAEIAELLLDPGIIRHRGKLEALRGNARSYLELAEQQKPQDYFWSFVEHAPKQNRWGTMDQVPVYTDEAERMSKDLKKRGFKFVGPTICYAFMQSAGLVNDHLLDCFRHELCRRGDAIRQRVD